MGRNLTNLNISSSFQHLLQVSSSNSVNDGTGSLVTNLDITASNATSASYAVTASHALNGGVTSIIAGTNITLDQSTGDVTISAIGGAAPNTGSLITTASNDFSEITFTKGDGSTFPIDATPRKVIETVKNKAGETLAKGTPVYVSGSTGNASNVYKADAASAATMPAAYVLAEQLTADQEGSGILAGFINGVDTSAFQAGDNIYVAVGGGYTNTKPTGSALIQKLGNVIKVDANGSGVITGAGRSNDLPNITTDYVWKGDSNGVPQAVNQSTLDVNSASTATSSSHAVNADSSISASHATQAVTASYVNPLQQNVLITGSLTMDGNIDMDTSASYIRFLQNPQGGFPSNLRFYSGSTYGTDYFHIQSVPGERNSLTIALEPNNLHFIDFQETGSGLTIPRTSIPTYLRVSGSKGGLNVLTEWPANFGVEKVWDFGTWTSPGGGTYSAETRLQNYGGLGPVYEGIIDVFSEEPNFGGTNYSSLVRGPKFVGTELVPTGSAGFGAAYKGQITLQDIGSAQTRVNIDANDISIGTTAVNNGTFTIGRSGQTVNFAGNQSIAGNLNVTGDLTGSNAYFQSASIGYLQTITGSAKIIGDEFIILNNDTPTSRYAGLKVQDSGSSAATASLLFDGQTNDWFYEYTSSGDALNHGVVLFGPEYGTIGSPTYNTVNTLVKSDGGHHMLDSNITDDGSTISMTGDVSITGGLVSTGSTVNLTSTIPGNFQINRALQYPSVDSVNEGWTYGENFVGMLDYSGVSGRYDKALMMGKADSAAFNYFGFVYNAGYDVGLFLDTPSGSLARISTQMQTGTGNADVYIYGDSIDIGTNINRTSDISIGNATVSDMSLEATDITVTGSLSIDGPTYNAPTALSITSQTASLDADTGDFYTLNLVSGSNTHLVVGNRNPGQTFILKTLQPSVGHGTITFQNAGFAGGTPPTATAAADAVDIYTFVTFDAVNIAYATQVANLS